MRSVQTHRKQLIFLILLAGLLSFGWVAEASSHPPIEVTTFDDTITSDGACSLREAIISANRDSVSSSQSGECIAGNGADTIQIPEGTYILSRSGDDDDDDDDEEEGGLGSSGDLDIAGDLTIVALGRVVVEAGSSFSDRILQVHSGTVSLEGLTIQGASTSAHGAGIYNLANLTVIGSTVADNSSYGSGGGIKNSGTLTVLNSTISGNSAKHHGGGLYQLANTATLNNVTLTNNTADSDSQDGGDGGGVRRYRGTLNVANSIIAGNHDLSSSKVRPDCRGRLMSLGYNLIQNAAGCTIDGITTGNILGVDPLLSPLGGNGGTTFTHALDPLSPAIDAGNPANPGSASSACETTDQIGTARPVGDGCDIGAYEFNPPATPALIRVIGISIGSTGTTSVDGLVPGIPSSSFTLNLYSGPTCDPLFTTGPPLETLAITTDLDGYFHEELDPGNVIEINPLEPVFLAATITDTDGDVSGLSECVVASLGNDSWPNALGLAPSGNPLSVSYSQVLDIFGQSLWYKFSVDPGSEIVVTLTNLPANYDLTVYKDIASAYQQLTTADDLERLSAEFAPSAFSPSAFSPSAFSPSAFSPSAFSPSAFSPSAFSPSAFSPSAFSPSAFSPSAFSPSAFSPSAFSPSAFSPDALSPSAFSPSAFSPSAFSPSAFSPSAFSPSAFSPSAFSAAQMQSLVGVSAFDGTAGEGLVLNSWNNTGDFYVRVRGREGAFSLDSSFTLGIALYPGTCGAVSDSLPATTHTPVGGSFRTVILTDLGRMEGTQAEKDAMSARLDDLKVRPEVNGAIVDVGGDARVAAANVQADANPSCPFAKNLVADAIRRIVDLYRPSIEYVVIVGNDEAIPFFRHPDEAYLGPEQQYVPPVIDGSASQASLRLNYVLSQDDYGAKVSVSYGSGEIPIPDLAVGRLVETPVEVEGMLLAYLGTAAGVVDTPNSSLVTGYDFLQDAADAIHSEFVLGLGGGAVTDTLIAPNNISPEDDRSWTANDLDSAFLTDRHDIVFLAGHFSASSALAADYRTSLTTEDLITSGVNLTNSIIFSAGCHSGYNIVNSHGVPGVTAEPDWAQAFAKMGATFIGGTGYQYGDTEFIEYSERLYLDFARQLRTGTGEVSVGKALVAAKQLYLANTPQMRGIHAKAFLEATLFGLPMLSVDMPGTRFDPPGETPIVASTIGVTDDPGATLGLNYADVSIESPLTKRTLELTNYDDNNSLVTATWLVGSDGILTNPAEPTLPLELRNVSVPGTILRGVGFRGGSYKDLLNILPLSGAPTTEIRGVHAPFVTSVFYPVRPWSVNYFDALAGGITRLAVTPAQFLSDATDPERGTMRQFDRLDFRLYYSNNISTFGESTPALAAPPTIVNVASSVSGNTVDFQVTVVDNPAAGIQEVWVTYTNIGSGSWQSVDLTQNSEESTLWGGSLTAADPANTRFIVQAANGLGLVTMATNLGTYYIPGLDAGAGAPTALDFLAGTPTSGSYGTEVTLSAQLTSSGTPLSGEVVTFSLGPLGRVAITDANGQASVEIPVLALPGDNEVTVFHAGSVDFASTGTSAPFTISKRDTVISLNTTSGFPEAPALIVTTLSESNPSGSTMAEQTIIFVLTRVGDADPSAVIAAITDHLGGVSLGNLPLPHGQYTVDAYFSGSVPGQPFSHEDDRYIPSSASAALTLLNHIPVALPDSHTTLEDTPLSTSTLVPPSSVLDNDTDEEGEPLTAVLVAGPASGTLDLDADGSFVYTPNADFNGIDSFDYVANDGTDNSLPAVVSITVTPENDAPVATADAYSIDEDGQLTKVAALGVLANDTDVDGDTLSAVLVPLTGPANGTLVLNSDGSFVYTPNDDFNGTDGFDYVANDGTDDSAQVSVTITIISINDAPTAVDDTYSIDQDMDLVVVAPGVLGNDSDVEDPVSALDAVVVGGPDNGTLVPNADGSFTYTPNPGYSGPDSFTYKAKDTGLSESNIATVSITVTLVNQPPSCSSVVAKPTNLWSPNGKFRTVTLSGAADPDGNPVTLTITEVWQDEPVGSEPDAIILSSDSVDLRKERDGNADGRVYHVFFEVTDVHGAVCEDEPPDGPGLVRVPVAHDNSGIDSFDGGALYDSTKPE